MVRLCGVKAGAERACTRSALRFGVNRVYGLARRRRASIVGESGRALVGVKEVDGGHFSAGFPR
jgi:hypothetical protein